MAGFYPLGPQGQYGTTGLEMPTVAGMYQSFSQAINDNSTTDHTPGVFRSQEKHRFGAIQAVRSNAGVSVGTLVDKGGITTSSITLPLTFNSGYLEQLTFTSDVAIPANLLWAVDLWTSSTPTFTNFHTFPSLQFVKRALLFSNTSSPQTIEASYFGQHLYLSGYLHALFYQVPFTAVELKSNALFTTTDYGVSSLGNHLMALTYTPHSHVTNPGYTIAL